MSRTQRGPRPGRRSMTMTSAELASRVGKRIRSARQELGLSQEKLAQQIDGFAAEISRYEHGKRIPSAETLRRLCLALTVSADRLLEIEHPHV